jgi:zinc transporter ZupT
MLILTVVVATSASAVGGWLCGFLPIWPLARLAVAAFLGAFVGAVPIGLFLQFGLIELDLGGTGVGAVSVGLVGDPVLTLLLPVLAAAVVYVILRRLLWKTERIARIGPVVSGSLVGVAVSAWLMRGLAIYVAY